MFFKPGVFTLLFFMIFRFSNAVIVNCPNGDMIVEFGMTNEHRLEALKAHNDCRMKLANGTVPGQPKACDMKQMNYDMALEKAAKDIALSCVFAHQKVNDPRWFAVGQNLYTWSSTGPAEKPFWNRAIEAWFGEYELYTYGQKKAGTGHYTQVAWADSTCVGCAYSYYIERNTRFAYKKLYVCNYGPPGNVNGRPPYKTQCQTNCKGFCPAPDSKCSGASNVSDFTKQSGKKIDESSEEEDENELYDS